MDNSNNDSHQFRFAGQTSSTYSLNFSVFKRSSTGGYVLVPQYNNISLTYQPCPGNVCADNIKIFNYVGSTNLGKGFYRIVVYRQYSNLLFNTIARKVTKCVVDFGVGDVYFIAGQSNASGWYWRDDKDQNGNYFLDNTISTTGEITKSSPMARTLNFKGDNGGMNGGGQSISKGIPYESNTENSLIFQELIIPATPTSASDQDNNRINIYPNGYNSWVYGPLGYKIATNNIDGGGKYEGTPSLWFNTAVGGTTINQGTGFNSWLDNPTNPSSLIGKLDYTLLNFAGPFGAKAVLWHQGEYDHLSYLSGSKSSNYKNEYNTGLSQIIEWTRQAVDNSMKESSKLNWFISDVSYLPYSSTPSNSLGSVSSIINPIPTAYIGLTSGSQSNWTSPSNLVSVGQTITRNRPISPPNIATNSVYFVPPNTPHLNIRRGPATDDLIGINNRTSRFLIHLSGINSLNTFANRWYDKLYSSNVSVSNSSIAASPLIPLMSVTKSDNNYTLTIASQSNSNPNNLVDYPAVKYIWVKNSQAPMLDVGMASCLSTTGITNNCNSATFNNAIPGDYLVGYVFKDGRLHPVQPYLVPGSSAQSKNIRIGNNNLIIPSTGGEAKTEVVAVLCDWEIVNAPINSTLTYVEPTGELVFSANANTTGSTKSEEITIKELGGTYTESIVVTQPAVSGTSTPLTSITPNANSSGYQLNNSTDGNTMMVSGVQYTQGIGTHAPSSMFFNLNGQYNTLSGKVGRDDESDNTYNSGNVEFTIKGDGVTLWTSTVHGNTTNAQSFNIDVAGKTTIELNVGTSTDGNYFDHADWIDMYLNGESCSNPMPTNVVANPPNLGSSGGSAQLSATCASGTPTWNTGQTGSPITVNLTVTTSYSVTCTSGSCNPSNSVGVTITVPTGPCTSVQNNVQLSTWTVTGHPLVARSFHNAYWLTQRIGTNPESFLVRGSEMLNRSDVNPPYSITNPELKNCFAFVHSAYGGLVGPNATEFPTPDGFAMGYECPTPPCNASNGTRYFYSISAPPSCSNSNLINSWTYASSAGSTTGLPRIGKSIDNGDMTMGSTNYTASYPGTGIGTHAFSEIIYDLGASHTFQYFKSTVGKDNESVCGENRLVFKVVNNATGAILAQSPVVGNPAYGLPQTYDMSVNIAGVRYLKLVVEDGGDNIYCDHANWARARVTCDANARKSAEGDSIQFETALKISPNPSEGELTIEFGLENDGPVSIQMLNSAGFAFKTESVSGVKGRNALKFDTGKNIVPGQYIISVVSPGQKLTGHVSIVK